MNMGNVGPGMLGSMLFLMVVLQSLQLSPGRFLHHLQSQRSFHLGTRHHRNTWEKLRSCEGAFDLYFIVDASQKANDIWKDIYELVDEIVMKYTNPNLRMSFITYSTQANTITKLTSDRNEIREGLRRLQNIVPTGATNMQEGFKKANEQIQQATSGDSSASSLIITLTAGPLMPKTLQETRDEADKARDMGAKVYCLGVKDYKKYQLHDIVERKDQMYGIDEFKSLEKFVTSLVENSCMDVMAGDTHFVCVGESYEVTFFASGLDPQWKDETVCRYQLGLSKVYNEYPTFMNQENLTCPGHTFDKAGQEVIIDYSLDNGVSFIGDDMKIASKDCVNDKVELGLPHWVEAETSWQEEGEPLEPTVVPTRTTLPTVVITRTTGITVVPDEETTVPEVVPEEKTIVHEVVPEEKPTVPAVVPQEETTVPEVVPGDEITEPEVVPEDEVTEPEVVPEDEVTVPEVVPEGETTEPEVVPEDETTVPTVVPEKETTVPTVVPEKETTVSTVVPEQETTEPEVFPEEKTTELEEVPEEETTEPEVFPEEETIEPEEVPEEETTVPEEKTTELEEVPEEEAAVPEVFPEEETIEPEEAPEEKTTESEVVPEDETTMPTAVPEKETTVPEVVPEEKPTMRMFVIKTPISSSPLWFPGLISALFLFLFLLLLVCICCRKRIFKEPPSGQKPEEKPCPVQGYSTVLIPCCGCQDRIRLTEGKLDPFYDFVQRCSQMPLIQYPSRNMGRCINFTLMNPHCTQMLCGPKICFPPSQECFPRDSCCSHCQHPPPICSQPPSRMLPLIPPPARKLCRSTLSLPPP